MSIVAFATSAAYRRGPDSEVDDRARPLKTAFAGVVPPCPPVGLSSTTNFAPPSQAAISPGDWVEPIESVETMKLAGEPLDPPTLNPFVGLNTWPVALPPGMGTVRSSETLPPPTPPLYTLANPELLSETQIGSFGPEASPHAFWRFGSTSLAPRDDLLATRLV